MVSICEPFVVIYYNDSVSFLIFNNKLNSMHILSQSLMDIYYTMKVVRNCILYIEKHLKIAAHYNSIGRQKMVCEHIVIAVNSIQMLLRFVNKSKVKDSISIKASMAPMYKAVAIIEVLYGQGWGTICHRLTNKKRSRNSSEESEWDMAIDRSKLSRVY